MQHPRSLVQDVLLASSVQLDQACALTVDLDSIPKVLWPAQHVLQEPTLPILALSASTIALNVLLGLMLQGEHLVVLHVMLGRMPSRLEQAAVLPV